MDKIGESDPGPGEQHREFANMSLNERAWATREPYGPVGEL